MNVFWLNWLLFSLSRVGHIKGGGGGGNGDACDI